MKIHSTIQKIIFFFFLTSVMMMAQNTAIDDIANRLSSRFDNWYQIQDLPDSVYLIPSSSVPLVNQRCLLHVPVIQQDLGSYVLYLKWPKKTMRIG